MTISVRYIITDANGNLIDWYNRTGVAALDIFGRETQVFGSGEADGVYVQAGTSANLTELSAGNDKIYLSGTLNDYSQNLDQGTGVYTLTRVAGLTQGQTEIITFTVGGDDDVLYFADGHISLNVASNPDIFDLNTGEFKQIVQGALQVGGTPVTPPEIGAPTTSAAPVNVFVDDASGISVPQAPQTGQALKVYGSGEADSVYVRKGTSVDATELSAGNDLVYLTGNLADYTQSIDQGTGVYTLTRTAGLEAGLVELVTFTVGGDDDVLYFADGSITLNVATNPDIFDLDTGVFREITLASLQPGGTPGLTDIQSIAVDVANSTTGQGGYYNNSDVIVFTVTMKSAMDVDTNNGMPRLKVALDNGASAWAMFDAVLTGGTTNQTELKFKYTVNNGDTDSNGVSVVKGDTATSAIDLHNGHIYKTGTTDAARLTLNPELAAQASYKVDSTAPELTLDTLEDSMLTAAEAAAYSQGYSVSDALSGVGSTEAVVKNSNGDVQSGVTATVNASTISADLSSLSDGEYIIEVTSTDEAGNQHVQTQSVTVDDTAPELTLDTLEDSMLTAAEAAAYSQGYSVSDALSGVGSTEAVVKNSNGDVQSGVTATVNASTISADLSSLSDGEYIIEVTSTDEAGNQHVQTQSVTVDDTAPELTLDTLEDSMLTAAEAAAYSQGYSVSDALSGVGSTEAVVKNSNGDVQSGVTATVNASTISADLSSLSDGEYIIEVTSTDEAGNQHVQTQSVTVDDTAPELTLDTLEDSMLTAAEAAAYSQGYSVSDALSGVGSTEAVVKNSNGDVQSGVTATVNASTISADLSSLSDGEYIIEVTSTDEAGNQHVQTQSVTVDDTAPELTLDTLEDSMLTAAEAAAYSQGYSVSDALSGVGSTEAVVKNSDGDVQSGVTATVNASTISADLSSLSDGEYIIEVTSTDEAGNQHVQTQSVTVDDTAPELTLDTLEDSMLTAAEAAAYSQGYSVSDALSGVGSTEAVVKNSNGDVQSGVTATVNASTISADLSSLSDGEYIIEVTSTDEAGNQHVQTQSVTVDDTAPELTLDTLEDSMLTAAEAAAYSQGYSVSDALSGVGSTEAVVKNSNGDVQSGVTATVNASTISADLSSLSDGEYIIEVTSTDEAGNQHVQTQSVTVDDTAPELTLDTLEDSMLTAAEAAAYSQGYSVSDALSGVGSTEAVVKNSNGDVQSGVTATVNASTISADLSSLSDGEYIIEVTSTDEAGNQHVQTQSVTVDKTAPIFQGAVTSVDGTRLILTYNETFSASTAPQEAFSVVVDGTAAVVSSAVVSGQTVVLTLATPVAAFQAVTVAYTDPSMGDDANALQDAAGGDAVTLMDTNVINTVPSGMSLAATGSADVGIDGLLADGGMGEVLQLSHLGLSDGQLSALQSLNFSSLNNLKLYSLSTAGDAASTATEITDLAGTVLSRADIVAGKYLLKYEQSDEATAGRNAFAAYTVSDSSGSYSKVLDIAMSSASGVAAWGDESGMGGQGSNTLNVVAPGMAGFGGADTLLGTLGADIVFGDGSGGGAGDAANNQQSSNPGGAGGGGADTIVVGAGDDIVFGDGFTGGISGAWSFNGGEGGYGGGGGGGAGMYQQFAGTGGAAGIGAGAGGSTVANNNAAATAGGSTTLGNVAVGSAKIGTTTSNTRAGAGAGVSADGNTTAGANYVAEVDSGNATTAGQYNNTGAVATTVAAARAAFLDGVGGSNAEDRLFTQTMGAGSDSIYGGVGNDYMMGGNGNDTIYGGQGNDIVYGRGGGVISGVDNDTLVWQRGDAGSVGAFDIVRDFTEGSDKLDIRELLEGYTVGSSDLSKWVTVQTGVTGASLVGNGVIAGSWDASQTGTLLTIDVDAEGAGTVTQRIFLAGTTLSSTNVNTLRNTGVLSVSTDTTAPVLQSAITSADGTKVVLTYNEPLNSSLAAAGAFTVKADSAPMTISSAAVSGNTVVLTLSTAILEDASVTVAYTEPTAGNDANAVQDFAGNDAITLSETSVSNTVGSNPPVFLRATLSADGTQLVLTYSETLNANTAPKEAFAVMVDGTAAVVNSAVVAGKTVVLTLATAVSGLQAVSVGYTDPSGDNDVYAVQDPAGNDAASLASTSVLKPLVLAATGAADVGTDNTLSDGGMGEVLQLSHLGLSDGQLSALQSLNFSSLNNLKLYSLSTAGDAASTATEITDLAGTVLSRADIVAGKYLLKYEQSDEATAGRNAFAAYTVSDSSGSYSKVLDIAMSSASGVAAWGDESGMGGQGSNTVNVVAPGMAGFGGADTLLGTLGADIVFGDGSGGGAGDAANNQQSSNPGGAGGGGADTIVVGAGDDIVFGDGFTGGISGAWSFNGGEGGYGGGGGGGAGMYQQFAGTGGAAGIGAGAGGSTVANNNAAATAGGSTTLGNVAVGSAKIGTTTSNTRAGAGAGVSADGNTTAGANYVAEVDSGNATTAGQYNNTGAVATTVAAARAAFLDGVGGSNAEDRLFTQTMGAGHDIIYGGAGNDYVMGGNGNDIIYGGQGNDIVYGRGGGVLVGSDSDTFVWHNGDASQGALDIVRDFGVGDVLEISNLLRGYNEGDSDLSQWVQVQTGVVGASLLTKGVVANGWDSSQSGTLISIDVDGLGDETVMQYIFLTGANLETNVNTLKNSGVLAVAPSVEIQLVSDDVTRNGSLTTVVNGGTTDDTTPLLKGSLGSILSDTQELVVYKIVNGVQIALGVAAVNGAAWEYQLSPLLAGTHDFKVAVRTKATESVIYSSSTQTVIVQDVPLAFTITDDVGANKGEVISEGRYVYVMRPKQSGWWMSLAEIEVYSDGVNIASQATVSVSAGWPAASLVDGDGATYFRTQNGSNDLQWIQLDFGTVRSFESVVLSPAPITSSTVLNDSKNLSVYVGNTDMAGWSASTLSSNGLNAILTVPDSGIPVGQTMTGSNTGKTDDSLPTLSGTLSTALGAGEELAVYDIVGGATTKIGVAQINPDLSWIFSPSQALSSGDHNFQVMIQPENDNSAKAGRLVSGLRSLSVTANTQVPVVFDLNQDGHIDYAQQMVDLTGDGRLSLTAWIQPHEGILFADENHDGSVNGVKEFAFGDAIAGITDLQGLARNYDSNHDGKLDAQDVDFALFKVWQDLNCDGISQENEVNTLSQVGVQSLNLTSDGHQQTPVVGVHEFGRTTASLVNGQTMMVSDVSFDSGEALVKLGNGGVADVFTVGVQEHYVKLLGFESGIDQLNLSGLMKSLNATGDDLRWVSSGNDLVLQVIQAQSVSTAVVFVDLGKELDAATQLMGHVVI